MSLTTTGNRVRKITPAQRQEIRDRYRSGDKVKDIAADYGVTAAAVSYHCGDLDRPEEHGTPRGYRRHQQRHEPGCGPCKTAWNAYCQAKKWGRSWPA
nr:MAG TPA_asm: helix-turn-helix domain protein [Caudoviricetes sp.]